MGRAQKQLELRKNEHGNPRTDQTAGLGAGNRLTLLIFLGGRGKYKSHRSEAQPVSGKNRERFVKGLSVAQDLPAGFRRM